MLELIVRYHSKNHNCNMRQKSHYDYILISVDIPHSLGKVDIQSYAKVLNNR